MLVALDIRNMALIDHLSLTPGAGLTVLTGETGAGKSILLDALGFVLGWKTRGDIVRAGAAEGEVTAVFQLIPGHAGRAVLAEAGMADADELILRRVAMADGRRSAWVNDRRAGAEVLRALSDTLVELHGQNDDRGLLDSKGHRAILDAFAGAAALVAETRACWTARSRARAALTGAEAALAEARREEDWLRHAVAELEQLAPEAGEEATLDQRRRQMQAGARIRDSITKAHQALGGQGAEGLMSDALRRLDAAAGQAEGRLDAPLAALTRAMDALAESEDGVARALEALDFDPRVLEATEERLFALRAASRKHGVAPDDLAGYARTLQARRDALDASAASLAPLSAAVADADKAFGDTASRLTEHRQQAAGRLALAVAGELGPLRMEKATFGVDLTAADPGPEGRDGVTFTISTGPGLPPGPLNRVASGGELSRFLLALKVCLTADGGPRTLIFDEIDRGVGGATADAVGRRLARLADGGQVLVVTHSPQVAAQGQSHWRVEKTVQDGLTTSRVVALSPDERVDEIARMLAGDTVTDAARAAATALIDGRDAA